MIAATHRPFVTWGLVVLASSFSYGVVAQTSAPSSPPATTSPAPKPEQPSPATETPAVVINGSAAETILGKPVQSASGENLGRIVDVIVDRSGTVRAAIIDFGGFLGVGTRKIAVDWSVLHFPQDGSMNKFIADLPRDQLRAAPAFKEGEPVVIMGANAAPAPASPQSAPASSPTSPVTPPDTDPSASNS